MRVQAPVCAHRHKISTKIEQRNAKKKSSSEEKEAKTMMQTWKSMSDISIIIQLLIGINLFHYKYETYLKNGYSLNVPSGPRVEGVVVSLWHSWEVRVSLEFDF